MSAIVEEVERTHRVLGLVPYASSRELEEAYRRRARDTHPDTGGSVRGFREVRGAYEYLSSPNVRSLYELETQHQRVLVRRQVIELSTERPVRRFVKRRRWWLLALSIFCWLVVPHVSSWTGWTYYPAPELLSVLQVGDWVFFLSWLLATK